MRTLSSTLAATLLIVAQPAPAIAQDLSATVDEISRLFDKGFDDESEDGTITRDIFLKAAMTAEMVLAAHSDLDAMTKRDMHYQAANGYYYAAEKEQWLANEADNTNAVTASMIGHLEQALAHQKIVFKDGQDGLLVAEYLFGTNMLVEHGMDNDDPRAADWSAANVHAGRLRIDESKMFGRDTHYDAMTDLAVALLNFVTITGDAGAKAEVAQLIKEIPDDERGYKLKSLLR